MWEEKAERELRGKKSSIVGNREQPENITGPISNWNKLWWHKMEMKLINKNRKNRMSKWKLDDREKTGKTGTTIMP